MTAPRSLYRLLPLLALLLYLSSAPARAESVPVAGQPVLKLAVEEVALLVLRNNRDLRVRQFNPVIANTLEQLERGVFDPEVFAALSYEEERATETSRSTGSSYEVDGSDHTLIAGLRQSLATGTRIEASVEQTRNISNRAPEQQQSRLGLTVTQALLRGFGPAVNLAGVRQAELGTVASRYELRAFTEALLAEAETAYWYYVLAQQQIAIFDSSLALARRQRDETKLRIEVGLLAEVEGAAARAEVARREQALIEARSELEERRLRLLRLVNPDPEDSFEPRIEALSEPRSETVPLTDLAERLQLAEKLRPDLNQARLQLQQQALEIVVTRNGLLPRLDFFITLGKSGYADSFADSFRELDDNTYDLAAGLSLSHSLGNRAAKARQQAARVSQRQAEQAVANLLQLVRLDVRLAANELERARLQITASAATRVLQEQTLVAEQERFEAGASTNLLVSQAQRDLLASQIDEVRAIVNYRIARVNLYLAEGSLLERRGIELGS